MIFTLYFFQDEEGLGTIELVLLIAILVALALVFRVAIKSFLSELIQKLFDVSKIDISY